MGATVQEDLHLSITTTLVVKAEAVAISKISKIIIIIVAMGLLATISLQHLVITIITKINSRRTVGEAADIITIMSIEEAITTTLGTISEEIQVDSGVVDVKGDTRVMLTRGASKDPKTATTIQEVEADRLTIGPHLLEATTVSSKRRNKTE
jgi:hypothetical protein